MCGVQKTMGEKVKWTRVHKGDKIERNNTSRRQRHIGKVEKHVNRLQKIELES
jgi:hypothetical protein